MTRSYAVVGAQVRAFGDTYPIRSRLKSLGASWSGSDKSWMLQNSADVIQSLEELGFKGEVAKQSASPVAGKSAGSASASAELLFPNEVPVPQQGAATDFSVSDLCGRIQLALNQNLPSQFWLVGELNAARNSRGHWWLEVSDPEQDALESRQKTATVSAVIWSGVYSRLKRSHARQASGFEEPAELPLEEGLKVRLFVHVDFRAEGGRLQIIVDDIDTSYTQGQLALSKEQILAELRKRGLTEMNKRMPMPRFPMRIALITANESRARNDFLHEIQEKGSNIAFQVTLFDCRMQGESTSPDITRVLAHIHKQALENGNQFDAIVITRGGGSRMDLRWFDDIEIAKAIATSPVPVLSAIGHHDDKSVADEVSFRAEKTPTAAAQFLIGTCLGSHDQILSRVGRVSQAALGRIQDLQRRTDHKLEQVKVAAKRSLEKQSAKIESHERLLSIVKKQLANSLKRGFSLVHSLDKQKVLLADQFLTDSFPEDVCIEMKSKDGKDTLWLQARVVKVEKELGKDDSQ